MSWDLGQYEYLAGQFLPAAQEVVTALAPRPGEVVVDIGCGTGSAAFLAAEAGAEVVGVDPSPRLLEVAAAQAGSLPVTFRAGDAAGIPLPDASADAVISSFGIIFAPDPVAAAREVVRVLRPGGRLVMSAWLREGALTEQARIRRELSGQPSSVALFAWHDRSELTELLAPLGFSVVTTEHELALTGGSPESYTAAELTHHPMWVQARPRLEAAGNREVARERLLAMFTEANEDPDAFRTTARFVIHRAVLKIVGGHR